jgi:hypothetical protein
MARPKGKSSTSLIEQMLDEASWLLSHAQALGDYGRKDEAAAEWARATTCEEQVACLLDADGQELEAAIHRVSAASCCEKLGQHVRAVTLFRAALSAPLHDDYRARINGLLAPCLAQAQKELIRAAKRGAGKQSPAVS